MKASKIWFLQYEYDQDDLGKSHLKSAKLMSYDRQIIDIVGDDILFELMEVINNLGAVIVYVWNMGEFGLFVEYFALSNGLPNYNDAERYQDGDGKIAEPCYNALYAGKQGILNYKLTLPRTKRTKNYKGGKLGGLHTVEYRGLSPLFGNGRNIDEVAQDYAATGENEAQTLCNLFGCFLDAYNDIIGDDYLLPKNFKRCYTVGAVAKQCYLKMRYGITTPNAYQAENYQTEEADNLLRSCHLLLGGMCFYPRTKEKKLHYGNIYKYDNNSLYSWAAMKAGNLGYPEETTMEDFTRNGNKGEYAYIIIFDKIELSLKKGYLPVFDDPFKNDEFLNDYNGNTPYYMQIDGKFAMFGELFRALQKYYTAEDFEVSQVLKCKKIKDDTIVKYIDKFFKQKQENKGKNASKYHFAKLMLNGLLGKFCQNTIYKKQVYGYNIEEDSVEVVEEELIDNWERSHFHFVRGAYIYTLARVKVMNDLLELRKANGGKFDHFYTDTDSIITSAKLPDYMCDDIAIGQYKIEEVYNAFGVVSQKIYYGTHLDGTDKLTCAGVKKGIILAQLRADLKEGYNTDSVFKTLCKPKFNYSQTIICRGQGGATRKIQNFTLGDVRREVEKILR